MEQAIVWAKSPAFIFFWIFFEGRGEFFSKKMKFLKIMAFL